jgi:hypothetical protein
MTNDIAELWIRLDDGRSYCERYNQREMAEFMRENMLERVSQGETLVCYDGEAVEIPAKSVKRIDFVVPHQHAGV